MTESANESPARQMSFRAILASQIGAIVALSAATLAVFIGIYWLAVATGAPHSNCLLAAVAAGLIWICVASPLAAAGPAGALESAVRLAAVIDTAGVALLVIWLWSINWKEGRLEFLAAVKVYCVYAAVGLLALAAVRLARSPHGRFSLASAVAVALLLAAGSPFWINGLLECAAPHLRQAIVSAAVGSNPFYAITSAVVDQTNLVWHQAPVLYNITRIGEYNAPPPAQWWPLVTGCLILAAMLAALGRIANRPRRPH